MASTSAQLEENYYQLIQERDEKAKNLIRGRCVGRGTSGIVYEVTERWLGKRWVIKDFFAVNSAGFKEKVTPLVFLEHENIVQYYWCTFGTSRCSIVLEYVDDDLRNVVRKKREAQWKKSLVASGTSCSESCLVNMEEFLKPRSVTNPDGVEGPSSETLVIDSTPFALLDAIEIMFQIATGMEYLHGKGVPHGDLTPNNVCVSFTPDQRMQVKLTDYGLLGIKKRMKMAWKHARQSEVLLWKAPELFEEFLGTSTEDSGDPWTDSDTESDEEMQHEPNASEIDILKEKKADVYSFAVLCSLILAGEVSYPNLSSSDLREQISCNNLRPKLPPTCPDLELLKTLVMECWDRDFTARPDFFEICERLRSIRTAQQMTTRGCFSPQTLVPTTNFIAHGLQGGFQTPIQAVDIDQPSRATSISLSYHERLEKASMNELLRRRDLNVRAIIFDIIETTQQAALNAFVNKRQCKRLAERFEAVRESLRSGQKQGLERIDNTHRCDIGTLLKRGKALVIKYQDVATIVTSVIKWRCNREAFKEIHKDIDNLKWELDLETFYAHEPGSFERITGEERERVLERDAAEDRKWMSQGLKDLHIDGLDLKTLELVVDEKPQGKDYWPGYLVIEPSKIQFMTRPHRRPHESSSEADKYLEDVYRGKWLNCDFHVKQFRSSEVDWNMEQMRKEVDSLIKLRHPHLIQLVGFAHDDHSCYVLMELMETESLRHLLNCQKDSLSQNLDSLSITHRPFSFHEKIDIIHQIAKGVLFLHKKGYVHGEIQCSNVFVKGSDGVFDVKIANFHCFRHLGKKSTTENTVSHQPAGSAPEAISDSKINDGEPTDFLLQKGDVYSFGMTCYEIMTGNLPIQDVSGRELVENIKRVFRPKDLLNDARDTLVAIVEKCWDPIPANRPDFDTICRFLGMKWQATEFGGRESACASHDFLKGWMMHKESEVMHKQKQRRVSIHIASKLNFPQYLSIDPMDLEPVRSIGEGSEVFRVQWLGCTFAAKQFRSTTNIQAVQEELQLLMELMHPHIVRLVGFSHNVESDRCAIVMEYMETDLNKLIDEPIQYVEDYNTEVTTRDEYYRRSPHTLRKTLNIIAQISLGMSYLHSHGIIHGDLKPSKVLVQYHGDHMHRIKIAHLGLSQYISEPPKRDVETSIWQAPEVLQGLKGSTDKAQPSITQASDVYSFGAICAVVLTGRRFSKEEMEYIGVRSLDGSINTRFGLKLLLEFNCYELIDLIRRCLDENPDLRPSSRSICEKLPFIIKEFLHKDDDYIQVPTQFV